MAPQQVTCRPRKHHTEVKHGGWHEYLDGVLNLVVNIGFVVGAILFLPGGPLEVADWMFIICSGVSFMISARTLLEARNALKVKLYNRLERDELFETIIFAVSAIVFFIGTIFFIPGIYGDDKEAAENGEEIGARLFIVGSFGYVMACFFNAEGMGLNTNAKSSLPEATECKTYFLHKYGLLMATFGAVFFVVGSVLYRPAFNTHCDTAAELNKETCGSTTIFGTYCYIAGACMYVLQSILDLTCTVLKHKTAYQIADESESGLSDGF
mmetsp:Transcript_8901/g.19583  ORF Transcript_8901/g.19583 Transcript_8901/m.19583 type:complete len:268 (+) Transcript_8901:76-879(+)|eukprot:CAMPEP_0170613920 /NCGR_PEP_ID=MMETSP0224-20130122/24526_1 /TAXON_ID=285029 /ORGANISM="Togula jolla, Strain CCCM 725" /LENGTH=267 /DNA_ID=CAMNT_0010939547 /DNA_START=69 /DNA_END=872 /DNA_ORIENTATION=-